MGSDCSVISVDGSQFQDFDMIKRFGVRIIAICIK